MSDPEQNPNRGPRGARGQRGEQGPPGERGERGARGLPGEKGQKGDKGERGERGARGLKGDKGDTGDRGERGARGLEGSQGEVGLNWRGDYDITLTYEPRDAVYFEGSSYVCIEQSLGDPPPGLTWNFLARKGRRGAKGEKGDDGKRGPEGERGPMGQMGFRGPAGAAGSGSSSAACTEGSFLWESAQAMTVGTGQKFWTDRVGEISWVRIDRPASDGLAAATIDVLLNGTSIFPVSPKPTLGASAGRGLETIPDFTLFDDDDYFQVVTSDNGGGSGPLRVVIHFFDSAGIEGGTAFTFFGPGCTDCSSVDGGAANSTFTTTSDGGGNDCLSAVDGGDSDSDFGLSCSNLVGGNPSNDLFVGCANGGGP